VLFDINSLIDQAWQLYINMDMYIYGFIAPIVALLMAAFASIPHPAGRPFFMKHFYSDTIQ